MSLLIDHEVFQKAKALGINASQASENYLKTLINAIEATNNQPLSLTGVSFGKEKPMAGGEGFEPSTPNLGGPEFWNRFRAWLTAKNYRGGYDSTLYNYAMKYSDCLFSKDLSRIQALAPSLRPNVMKALAALAKFTGKMEEWRQLMKNFGVAWGGTNSDDLLINRLNKSRDIGDVWEWVKVTKKARPNLAEMLDLMSCTGMRFVEAVPSYNLILELSDSGDLGKYYNAELAALEHYKYKETFLRDNKKVFVSFLPKEDLAAVARGSVIPTPGAIKKQIQKSGLPLRFGDIREAHGTLMVKYLKESEINFLHGRVKSSVFMQHYFNPALIGDLKARAFQGIAEIHDKIKL